MKWLRKHNGDWQTEDCRWIASERWNTVQKRHWVLLIGDSQVSLNYARRSTLREIKELVAEDTTEKYIARQEQDYLVALENLQCRLVVAPTDRGRQHIADRIRVEIKTTERNLEHFHQAVANQPKEQVK